MQTGPQYAGGVREASFDPLVGGATARARLRVAIARPGAPLPFGDHALAVPPPALRPACALLLSVLDRDVTFHVTGGPPAPEIREYLRFNSGARAVDPLDADFVLVLGCTAGATLEAIITRGSGPAADGVRVVYAPRTLRLGGGGDDVVLTVTSSAAEERRLWVAGMLADDLRRLGACSGVDVWLASADGRLAVLPRRTTWRAA